MSAIDDTRKLLQDMVSPDLKALEARVTALEQTMNLRFNHVDDHFKHFEANVNDRFKHFEEMFDLKLDLMHATMAANQQAILQAVDIPPSRMARS